MQLGDIAMNEDDNGRLNKEFDEIFQERERIKKNKFLQAKEQAMLNGKESFDSCLIWKYFPPYDHEKDEFFNDPERLKRKAASLEERYYVSYPEIMTLKEFGEKMCELREWGAFD